MRTMFLIAILMYLPSHASLAGSELPTSGSMSPDDSLKHGEEAHELHCYKCHDDEIYTRENSFVKSLEALSKQVVRCKDGNNIPWFEEDTENVIHFVNEKFYRF